MDPPLVASMHRGRMQTSHRTAHDVLQAIWVRVRRESAVGRSEHDEHGQRGHINTHDDDFVTYNFDFRLSEVFKGYDASQT